MSLPVIQSGAYKNLSASGAICPAPCKLIGFFVNSAAGGTLVVKNGGSGGAALGAAMTPVAPAFYAYPADIGNSSGAYATISGTIDITFFFTSGT